MLRWLFALILSTALTTTNGFSYHTIATSRVTSASLLTTSSTSSTLLRSASDDENAKLVAMATKLREEAAALEVALGKTPESKSIGGSSTSHYIKARWSAKSAAAIKSLSLKDPNEQAKMLRSDTDVFGSLPPNKLMDFTLPLTQLKLRSKGVLDSETLGVGAEDDVSLDDFKDATILVVVISSVLALASGLLLPQNIGAGGMYEASERGRILLLRL